MESATLRLENLRGSRRLSVAGWLGIILKRLPFQFKCRSKHWDFSRGVWSRQNPETGQMAIKFEGTGLEIGKILLDETYTSEVVFIIQKTPYQNID